MLRFLTLLRQPLAGTFIATGLCLAPSASQALCVSVKEANLRTGPGTEHAIAWEVFRYMPLQKVSVRQGWTQVRDLDGERHWVLSRLVSNRLQCGVVKASTAQVRTGPGNRYPALAWSPVERYFSFRVLKQQGAWLQIQDDQGDKGWIARSLVWRP